MDGFATGGLLNSQGRPLISDVRFDLSTYGDASATKDFRFDVNGIKLLTNLFPLPVVVITRTEIAATERRHWSSCCIGSPIRVASTTC